MARPSIMDHYALAREAYERPEVRFLSEKQHGVFILAVFRSTFTREHPAIPDDDFHQAVDRALSVLRDAGETSLPDASGRSLCLTWIQDGWLVKELGEDGQPVYSPSSATQTVLDWLASQSRRRLVSAPRVSQVFEVVAQLAALADPDRESLVSEHDALARRHAAEAERLRSGGDLPGGSDDELLQYAALVAEAMDQIPSDFRRVGEQFTVAQRGIREAMLTGEDTAGQVMASVTSAARRITSETPEGRAFMGVADLIRDDATMGALRNNVDRIMRSPAADMFTDSERVLFANIASVFVSNVDVVLQGPRALSRIVAGRLAAHVTTADQDGVAEVIQSARAALLAHQGALPESAFPALGQLRVHGSTVRMHDTRPVDAPRPLADAPPSTSEPLTLEYLRRWGGPHGERVADHVDSLLAAGRPGVTLAEAWEAAPTDLRRSVELLAYFASPNRSVHPDRATDVITVSEGHDTRQFRVPRITFTHAEENTP